MSKIIFNDDKIDLMKKILDEDISVGAIGLILYFMKHKDEDVKIETISKNVKECSSSISKYISELKSRGYLDIRRNVTQLKGNIAVIYYIGDRNRYSKNKNSNYNYKHKYCLERSMKLLELKNVSLAHLGAWYIIEYTNYRKRSFPKDEIVNKLKLKSKNVFKYISSYNKIKNEHFQNSIQIQSNEFSIISY